MSVEKTDNEKPESRSYKDGYEIMKVADDVFLHGQFEKARALYLRALDTDIPIKTKRQAAKTLVRLGRVLGDDSLVQKCTAQVLQFEKDMKRK
jgi:hypothetical protein